MSAKHWPCPHGCMNWVRGIRPNEPMTNHHPNCEFVDESLISVWRVSLPGESTGCVTDNEADARKQANEDPDAILDVAEIKMHREIYEHLGEFAGF